VVHAEDPLLSAAARATGVDLARETRDQLGVFMGSAFPAADWIPMQHVVPGPAVEAICELADREQTDLVVMAARGMSGAAHAMFGSTTDGVLTRSNVSVLVVPGSWRPARPESSDLSGAGPIIAALEAATPARAATAAACRLAHVLATRVEAIHVVPLIRVLDRWRPHAEAALEQQIAAAHGELEAWLPRLACEAPVDLRIETGAIAEQLAEAARAAGRHSLIVLGRRAPGARHSGPGAIAARLLSVADVPLLVYLTEE
jgi:nucleotide-binding universal stress UspA family protein